MLPHIQRILDALKDWKQTGDNQWAARCPAHDDKTASCSVGIGKDDRALIWCHAGCNQDVVLKAMGMTYKDLFPDGDKQAEKIVATYQYRDANGTHVYDVIRFSPKNFKQRRADGAWSMDGVDRVLYRLPELLASKGVVYVVEGEKDVDNLWGKLQATATCNPGGANKWSGLSDDSALHGRDVVIIADNDKTGREHANDVAARLQGKAKSIKLVQVPSGKDASDWLDAGGTDLNALVPMSVDSFDRDPHTGKLILHPKQTLSTAKAYLAEFHRHPDGRTLINYSGEPMVWRNNRYELEDKASIMNRLYPWLDECLRRVKGELVRYEANPASVENAVKTIMAEAYVPNGECPPKWINKKPGDPPADELLVCKSKSYHLTTAKFYPATPRLFVTASLDFDLDLEATGCPQWEKFLGEIFEEDESQIALLQQWFGYCLTMNTRQQKMMLIIGPKRSGKGTIANVLQKLIGDNNVVWPTTGSLATPFGLQPLIGKSLAIIGDARFGGENLTTVVEKLLGISGEDSLTIDRKFLSGVTMKLPTRFMIMTNETPRLTESSGALASRFLYLRLRKSWLGKEDNYLRDKLAAELPGILLWAIAGWHSLRGRGRFFETKAAIQMADEMDEQFSPVIKFVRERCEVGEKEETDISDLYEGWKAWCKEEGRTFGTPLASFCRDLRSYLPGLVVRQRTGGKRYYEGIGLKS